MWGARGGLGFGFWMWILASALAVLLLFVRNFDLGFGSLGFGFSIYRTNLDAADQ